jgi:hypothetical protein
MSKNAKLQHIPSGRCNAVPQIVQVVDGNGGRQFLTVRCMEERELEVRRVEINGEINLEKIRPNEERQFDIPFRNVGE